MLSDEIHADLVFPGVNHLPFPTVSGELRDISIVARAPSKSFNIPGLTISELLIPSERLRTRFSRYNRALFMHVTNLFSTIALEAAYREGGEGFHRMNVACPRRLVEEGCRRIAAAFR